MQRILTATAAIALMTGAAFAQDEEATPVEITEAVATFVDMEGAENGTASLTGTPNGVLIQIEVSGLPAGEWLAFHVHETGECDAATHHDSAGGHFNPGDVPHGYMAEGGPHAGDMPNQYVGEDGVLRAQVFNSMVTLGDGGEADIAGRALMIHGGADDYMTQPTGDAGDRHACGVIEEE
ncbi:superoxide dismutase family protein [Aliihoeflea aestuarii]|uniref:superoxide dismutase family protein n=1 Tax=Aliihoeflea aestuarii TaxID=453840 RepID=UPI002094A30F|nr:superoxide dismutase family protein [Aliihoeflea aestuarii]MCO6392939.1 superoxide dismutase family protein [Aliihoeflea aestuarii]